MTIDKLSPFEQKYNQLSQGCVIEACLSNTTVDNGITFLIMNVTQLEPYVGCSRNYTDSSGFQYY